MTPTRAVLHVGTMKTGTSTLQAMLAQHQDRLAQLGWRSLGWPMRTADRIGEQLRAGDPNHHVIISDEGLWHFSGTQRSDTERIAEVLADHEVSIVVYFRRPDEYVEAWFSQGLKNGLGSTSVEDFLCSGFVNSAPHRPPTGQRTSIEDPALLARLDLAIMKRLTYFETTFPEAEIIVRPFERAQMVDSDIVADFFQAIGLGADAAVFDRLTDKNVSPSADTVLFASWLRQEHHLPEDVLQIFLATHSPPAIISTAKRRILRCDEAVAINEAVRPIFREVQARWGGGRTEDFFVNWDVDRDEYHVSEFRAVHDRITSSGNQSEPPV